MTFIWMLILPVIILFVIVLGIGVTFVRAIFRFLGFPTGTRFYETKSAERFSNRNAEDSHNNNSKSTTTNSRKIIGDDEGEYVEYEEIV